MALNGKLVFCWSEITFYKNISLNYRVFFKIQKVLHNRNDPQQNKWCFKIAMLWGPQNSEFPQLSINSSLWLLAGEKMQVLQYETSVTIKTHETKDMWTGMSWSDAQRWHTPSPHSSFPSTWSNGVTYSNVGTQQRQTRSPVHQRAPRSSDAVWIRRGDLQVIVCGDGARLATGGVTESLFSTWLGFISTLPWARS